MTKCEYAARPARGAMATWRAPPVSAPESEMNRASAKSIAASDKRIALAASAWVWVSITQIVVVAALEAERSSIGMTNEVGVGTVAFIAARFQ